VTTVSRMVRLEDEKIGPVQAGIPLPPRPGKRASEVRMSIAELQPGESRVLRGINPKSIYSHCKLLSKIEAGECEYATRTIADGIVRVWRVR
jgi:hypothetical protein